MKQVYDLYVPDTDKHFSLYMKKQGTSYQKKQRDNSLQYVSSFGVAVDVGAHVGTWARELENKFDKVICFEPLTPHVECLIKNIKYPDKVQIIQYALGDTNGKEVLMDYEKDHNTGTAGILPRSLNHDKGKYKAIIRKLDSFGISTIDYIKVDIEGYELPFLKGAKETLLRTKPVLNIEIKNTCERFGTNAKEIVKYLEKDLHMMCIDRCVNDYIFVYRYESC